MIQWMARASLGTQIATVDLAGEGVGDGMGAEIV